MRYNDPDGKPTTKQHWLEMQGITLEEHSEWEQQQVEDARLYDELEEMRLDEIYGKMPINDLLKLCCPQAQ